MINHNILYVYMSVKKIVYSVYQATCTIYQGDLLLKLAEVVQNGQACEVCEKKTEGTGLLLSCCKKNPENWPTKVRKYEAAYISMASQPHRKMNNK